MKLLLDQNLSFKLLTALADVFPDASHVRVHGLASADDQTAWDFANAQGFALISKDGDFHQRSLLYGTPPKVIWLRLGNCSTVANPLEPRQDHRVRTRSNLVAARASMMRVNMNRDRAAAAI